MNAAHLHLVVNHLPLFATALALPLLAVGLVRRSPLTVAAYLLVVAGLATGVSMKSGDDAEDIAEALDHTETTDIHEHEEAAERAGPLAMATAAVAIVLTVLDRMNARRRRLYTAIVLVCALASSAALFRTNQLGGKINHREIKEGFDPNKPVTPTEPLDL